MERSNVLVIGLLVGGLVLVLVCAGGLVATFFVGRSVTESAHDMAATNHRATALLATLAEEYPDDAALDVAARAAGDTFARESPGTRCAVVVLDPAQPSATGRVVVDGALPESIRTWALQDAATGTGTTARTQHSLGSAQGAISRGVRVAGDDRTVVIGWSRGD